MVYDMGAPSPTGMGERLTKMSYSFAKYRILFTLVVTIAILILIMNIHHMQDTHSTTLKTAPYSKDFAFPRSYQSLKQKIQMKKVVATVKPMICHYQNQSSVPEERSEEMFLLKMIEWPMPPQARTPFMNSTDPKHSHFLILNSQNTFHVGDQLQVMVHMYDFSGNPKQYGGDYLQARIHTPELKAGSVGTVVDYLNGSYKINFTLFWPGKVEVSVTLVHPSEGIQVLQRLRDERPDKVYFKSLFRSGSVQETTMCSVCLPETAPLCNFTDLKTGERWFCYKPKKLPCTTRLNHAKGGYKKGLLKGAEGRFLTSIILAFKLNHIESPRGVEIVRVKVNLQQPVLPSGPGFVNVKASTHAGANLRRCVRGKSLASPSGFYYQDQWMSATCNIHRFNTPNITACLRKKIVHLFGDSTIRQWFEYLTKFQPGLKRFPLGNNENTGPHLAIDMKNQIMVKYHCHAPPIRFYIETPNMLYIANALDGIKAGKNTIIAITLWSHFGTFPVEIYIRRIQNIRRSILLLLNRNPDTQIVMKTANVQALTPEGSLYNNNWDSFQLDVVLRKMFKGINVSFVDAWEMTVAHYLPHELHPQQIIIKNEIDTFLSHVCPFTK